MLCSKRLLGAFNDTDAAVPDAVVAVPAIVESRERAAPSAAETAAVLAGFKLGAETNIKSDPVRAEQLASGASPSRAAAEPSRSTVTAARPSRQPRGHLDAGPREATARPAPQRRRTPSRGRGCLAPRRARGRSTVTAARPSRQPCYPTVSLRSHASMPRAMPTPPPTVGRPALRRAAVPPTPTVPPPCDDHRAATVHQCGSQN